MQIRFIHLCCTIWMVCCAVTAGSVYSSMAATTLTGIDVFAQLTQHIQRQAKTDKQAFAAASQCVTWFYKHQKAPAPPSVRSIAWSSQTDKVGVDAEEPSDCRTRYPGGLDAVRADFQRTQAFLSLTLTFYEFALVGDGDDNARYSARELRDVLLALDLSSETSLGTEAHLHSLTSSFDRLHDTRGMEALMAGMGKLYDQGYRVTPADRANLNRVME